MAGESWAQTCDGPNPDKTAVLVYFVGLMVFERKTSPPALLAHVPDVADHAIELYTGARDRTHRGLKWEPKGVSSSISDLKIDFTGSKPPLKLEPQDLLTAKQLHPDQLPQPIQANLAELTMRFDSGTFKTCSWVMDEDNKRCTVKVGNNAPLTRMAETMVLEIEIDCVESIRIEGVQPSIDIKPIFHRQPRPYPKYERTFEIALTNVHTGSTGRLLTTHHTRHLKDMFQDPKGTWSPTTAYDCQPHPLEPCFEHFASYLPRFSGFNRPICPLIEGP